MKNSQKRAIYYANRQKKLNKIEELGLMDEYLKFKGKSRYNKITWFAKKNQITL